MSTNRPISFASVDLPVLGGLAVIGAASTGSAAAEPTVAGPALAGLLSVVRNLIPGPYLLFLEELIRRDGDDHFPRLRIDEIGQREDRPVNHPGDDRHNRQKAEQTGHRGPWASELTI